MNRGKSLFRSGRIRSLKATCIVGLLCLIMMLVACGSQKGNESQGDFVESSEGIGQNVEWSFDSDCGACHSLEQASYDDSACLASSHTSESCLTCHSDEAALSEVHQNMKDEAKSPKRLKATAVPNELCLSCHFGSLESLVEQTGGITNVEDTNGTAVNPHAAMISEAHAAESLQMDCSECHSMHGDKTAEEAANLACLSCHHAGVFECYTCHD